MAHTKNHEYIILPPSIWPLVVSVAVFVMLFGAVLWMTGVTPFVFLAGFVGVLYGSFSWWAAMVDESEDGEYSPVVRIGIRYGFILFIMSEVMFFAAWFWSFFKQELYPMSEMGDGQYTVPDIIPVNAWDLPLVNTLLLLLSGCAVTWAHHALVHNNDRKGLINGLTIGIIFGVIFTCVQAYEYWFLVAREGWQLAGDVHYANFFLPTGFHGLHVILGTIFLAVCLYRAKKGHFTPTEHAGFECAAWYWHFVDVVWLFLFFAVYIWGM